LGDGEQAAFEAGADLGKAFDDEVGLGFSGAFGAEVDFEEGTVFWMT